MYSSDKLAITEAPIRKGTPTRVFILGAPRSGTTLLLNMLAREQSHIGGFPDESQFYTSVYTRPYSLSAYLDTFRSRRYFLGLVSEQELKDIVEKSSDHLTVFNRVIDRYLAREAKTLFVEKSPVHTLFFREIIRDFNQPYVILLKRNPAANVHSMVTARWSSLLSDRLPAALAEISALKYLAAVCKYYRYARLFEEIERYPRAIVMRYEDVVLGRIRVEEMLAERLGIPIAPLWISRPFSAEVQHRDQKLDTSRVDGYRKKMPKAAQRLVKSLFEPATAVEKVISKVACFLLLELPFRAMRRR